MIQMLNNALKKAQTVAIGGHIRPDGDCVGSCMGLYQYIKNNYPDISLDIYLEEIPDSFCFIEATKDIRHEADENQVYDLFIALDCSDASRLAFSNVLFQNAKATFCIDHHVSNVGFADTNYMDADASSTSELVYRMLEKDKITTEIAECLYLGIVHDTGVFQYSCTSPETMEAAADLMRRGVRASFIIDKTFYEKTYAQNLILGQALLDSKLLLDGKCIASYLNKDVIDFYGLNFKELDGIICQLRITKDVEVAMFLYELGANEYKVSLRANGNVDVSKIAQHFGGGGHVKAAGFSIFGTPQENIEKIVSQVELQLRK